MNQDPRQRILKLERLLNKAEEFVSIEFKKRADRDEVLVEIVRPDARRHATAVAAIVIAGEPKIDERLVRAWGRTLRHYGITIRNEYGRVYEYKDGHEHEYKSRDEYKRELKAAYDKLYPAIINGDDEAAKFTQIFGRAPIWLLEFTSITLDAYCLKFTIPKIEKQPDHKYSTKWPLLPLGTMADSDPGPADESVPVD
jgi:hypothetical protein